MTSLTSLQINPNMTSPDSPQYIVADVNFVAPHFPQYKFIELLGQGAMGAAFRAVQTKLDREIVFKVIARRIGRNEAFFDAFTTQAKLTAKLNHTNVVKVFDFGGADEMLFLIQEYVSGMPLDVAIRGSKVDLEQSLQLMLGISNGLMHAHSHGVVHGDLQTSTVFLNDAAVPKINDFGLAMALRANGSADGSSMNPNYTAPEVLRGEIFGDEVADVYSLGGIFYRLLTGYHLSDQKCLIARVIVILS